MIIVVSGLFIIRGAIAVFGYAFVEIAVNHAICNAPARIWWCYFVKIVVYFFVFLVAFCQGVTTLWFFEYLLWLNGILALFNAAPGF